MWATAVPLLAQSIETLLLPTPLMQPAAGAPAGAHAAMLTAAQRAQDLGLLSIAIDIYRQAREAPGADRAGLTLTLVTALLDAGRAGEAETLLAEIPEPRNAAWHLRAGLAAVQLKKVDAARAELAAIREQEVSVEDYPWYWFLQGAIVDLQPLPETSRANDFYRRAENVATTELEKARFQLAGERVRLRRNEVSESGLEASRGLYRQHQGTPIGYEAAEVHAMALAELGRTSEAEKFLQDVLLRLPRQERDWGDRFRLILGMIGDRTRNGAGRTALNQLVEGGHNPERQRQALQLLMADSRTGAERQAFRVVLNRLIDARPDHPIKDSLLLVRAQTAVAEKEFIQAELDANALLRQFPTSKLKVHAHGVLTQSAWEQRRFRVAAEQAARARDALQAPAAEAATNPLAAKATQARFELGVVEAEARFRAGLAAGDRSDFRLAADAYAAVLRERPGRLEPKEVSGLMLQRALAEVRSGSADAGRVIDELARDPAFDLESRWQAEWSLARALQIRGDAAVKEAFARVSTLLREPVAPSGLDPKLRARMQWLQVQLSFDNAEFEQTVRLADALLRSTHDVPAWLKEEIASTAILLKARAQFALNQEAEAVKTLAYLRSEYPKKDAAMSSYLAEAVYYERLEKIDEARNRLIKLTDNPDPDYKNSPYVPRALFLLAELAERLGRMENLQEANQRIEDLIELVNRRPAPRQVDQDLYFAARKKQGDILRKRDDFSTAQRAYEELINRYPQRPDIVYVQLALAECHHAQAATDTNDRLHAENARRLFEQLRDRVDAPDEVRMEAGYNLGKLLEQSGKTEEAAKAWWQDLVQPTLDGDTKVLGESGKRSYWLARTMRDLGELLEKQGKVGEAAALYRVILDKNLPYIQAVAKSRLEQLGALPPKGP